MPRARRLPRRWHRCRRRPRGHHRSQTRGHDRSRRDDHPRSKVAQDADAQIATIPHPYRTGAAAEWIARHAEEWATGRAVTFAVVRRADEMLVGALTLRIDRRHSRAELGYWIGTPDWGQGFATEAASAALRFGFGDLHLNRIFANHFTRNPPPGGCCGSSG